MFVFMRQCFQVIKKKSYRERKFYKKSMKFTVGLVVLKDLDHVLQLS